MNIVNDWAWDDDDSTPQDVDTQFAAWSDIPERPVVDKSEQKKRLQALIRADLTDPLPDTQTSSPTDSSPTGQAGEEFTSSDIPSPDPVDEKTDDVVEDVPALPCGIEDQLRYVREEEAFSGIGLGLNEEESPTPPHSHTSWQWVKKPLLITVGSLIAVVVLGAGARSFGSWRAQGAYEAALSECQAQVAHLSSAQKTFDTALTDTVETAKITASQVADPQTVPVLKDARDAQTPKALTCDQGASTEELTKTTETLSKNVSTLKTQATAVTEAAEKVTASKEKKDLDTATKTLTDAISAAQGTYDTTSGKVADEKTRDTLKTVLDAANTEVKNEKRTIKSLSDQKKTLDDAVKAVNDSVKAKADADAKAAARAEEQKKNSAPSYRAPSYQYSVPRSPAPSPSTPSVPSTPVSPPKGSTGVNLG